MNVSRGRSFFDPARDVQFCVEAVGFQRNRIYTVETVELRISLCNGVPRAHLRVEIERHLLRAQVAIALSRVHRTFEISYALVVIVIETIAVEHHGDRVRLLRLQNAQHNFVFELKHAIF